MRTDKVVLLALGIGVVIAFFLFASPCGAKPNCAKSAQPLQVSKFSDTIMHQFDPSTGNWAMWRLKEQKDANTQIWVRGAPGENTTAQEQFDNLRSTDTAKKWKGLDELEAMARTHPETIKPAIPELLNIMGTGETMSMRGMAAMLLQKSGHEGEQLKLLQSHVPALITLLEDPMGRSSAIYFLQRLRLSEEELALLAKKADYLYKYPLPDYDSIYGGYYLLTQLPQAQIDAYNSHKQLACGQTNILSAKAETISQREVTLDVQYVNNSTGTIYAGARVIFPPDSKNIWGYTPYGPLAQGRGEARMKLTTYCKSMPCESSALEVNFYKPQSNSFCGYLVPYKTVWERPLK